MSELLPRSSGNRRHQAERAIATIASLVAADRRRVLAAPRVGAVALRLFEMLPVMPRFTFEQVRQKLATRFPTATPVVEAAVVSPASSAPTARLRAAGLTRPLRRPTGAQRL